MTEQELIAKMDDLGRMLNEAEEKQLAFDLENKELFGNIEELKAELKDIFLERKESMKSQCLEVQYRKGAVKWDTKWLDGFAIDHPEYNLGQYRKIGKPTVAFSHRAEGWADDGR